MIWTEEEVLRLLKYTRDCMWQPAEDFENHQWEYLPGQTSEHKGITEPCYATDEQILNDYKIWRERHSK